MNLRPILLLPCMLVLAACGGPTQAPPPAAAPAPPSASTNETMPPAAPALQIAASPGHGVLQADPATLRSCEPAIVNLRWDIVSSHPDVKSVEVHVIAPGETAGKLFAAGGPTDAAATGPWAKPGLVFLLSDTAGKELDRITLGGPDCR